MTLYAVLSSQLVKTDSFDLSSLISSVALVYFPTILEILCYTLMYWQLEQMSTLSKINQSRRYERFQNKKLIVGLRITLWIILSLFVVIEFLLMGLAVFNKISNKGFQLQLGIYSGIIIVALNVN